MTVTRQAETWYNNTDVYLFAGLLIFVAGGIVYKSVDQCTHKKLVINNSVSKALTKLGWDMSLRLWNSLGVSHSWQNKRARLYCDSIKYQFFYALPFCSVCLILLCRDMYDIKLQLKITPSYKKQKRKKKKNCKRIRSKRRVPAATHFPSLCQWVWLDALKLTLLRPRWWITWWLIVCISYVYGQPSPNPCHACHHSYSFCTTRVTVMIDRFCFSLRTFFLNFYFATTRNTVGRITNKLWSEW